MILFPAMDLKEGKCVRLYQGDFSTSEIVGESPLKTAQWLKGEGAEFFHMVDLDGAKCGKMKNLSVVEQIINEVKIPIQIGGGIRDIETIDMLIEKGISRVILGTAAINNPEVVKEAVKKYGDKIAVGIDAKYGYVAAEGWLNISKIKYIDFAKKMEEIGVQTIIFTDITKDGTLKGPNFEQTILLNDSVSCDIIASGGIKNIDDLKILNYSRIYGAILGKSIYSKSIILPKALEALI